ncbi:MAG: sarcosine oxidase, subunit alpha [Solirubrobacteraceae bacterium]|nr:sarcosine oxidase, subunit alpha [Solirubrobacteraceae bacterium]
MSENPDRLSPQPSELIDRYSSVSFTFDGKPISGLRGDTIASALYAAGQRTFSRSVKYHRRRGLMCCSGDCPNCLIKVDGKPGMRACTEPVREGARVEPLHAIGGPDEDLPKRRLPGYEWVARRRDGAERLSAEAFRPGPEAEQREREADLLVVGGGVAGLSGAIAAAELGANVVLADDGPQLGGRLLWEGGHEQARALVEQARRLGVELLSGACAEGHSDGRVLVRQGPVLHRISARRNLYATGAIEQPLMFAGNDLPGVMLSGGARRLASLYGVLPGTRAVVVTTSDRGVRAAIALAAAGVQISVVADLRPEASRACRRLPANGVQPLQGWTILAARGRREVRSVVLAPVAALRSGASPSQRRELECDLLIVSGGDAPAASLITAAGGRTKYDPSRGYFRLTAVPEGSLAAGQLAGEGGWGVAELSGQLAGLEVARGLGLGNGSQGSRRAALRSRLAANDRPDRAVPPADAGATDPARSFACFCSDVSAKDIHKCVEAGQRSIDQCKQNTFVTMGPCEGRMCALIALRLMAKETGQSPDQLAATPAPVA